MAFPTWKPQIRTASKFEASDFKIRYKALRNSSSGFIKRKDVRDYIFQKYNGKCYLCGSTDDLQVDHIISVYLYALNKYPYKGLNQEENLAAICRKCNCKKQCTYR